MPTIYERNMYNYPHKTAYRPVPAKLVREYYESVVSLGSVYVHIPFCTKKCAYCNLFSVTGRERIIAYVDAVVRQAKQIASFVPRLKIGSLIVGGGTPNVLTDCDLLRLIQGIAEAFGVTPENSYSIIDVTPGDSDRARIKLLKDVGFKKVSVGVESFVPEELKALGRPHSAAKCRMALDNIFSVGFDDSAVNLIYGIPGQTVSTLLYTLSELTEYMPTEAYAYPLYVKPMTALAGRSRQSDRLMLGEYKFARDFFINNGFKQISMRRFTLREVEAPTFGFKNSIALGCGGRSYIDNLHFMTPFAVRQKDCVKVIDEFICRQDFTEGLWGYLLNLDEVRRRYLIKNLFLDSGLSRAQYAHMFGSEVDGDYPALKQLKKDAYVEGEEILRLTEKGMSMTDSLAPSLMSAESAARMKGYYTRFK